MKVAPAGKPDKVGITREKEEGKAEGSHLVAVLVTYRRKTREADRRNKQELSPEKYRSCCRRFPKAIPVTAPCCAVARRGRELRRAVAAGVRREVGWSELGRWNGR